MLEKDYWLLRKNYWSSKVNIDTINWKKQVMQYRSAIYVDSLVLRETGVNLRPIK